MSNQPQQAAQIAGLRYVSDCQPGLTRRRWGKGFTYLDERGDRIADAKQRKRLKSLKIPPSWTEVWICPDGKGHLLATGRDTKGRKQYLYHPDWRSLRNRTKFDRVLTFGQLLPKLRQQVDQDIAKSQLSKQKVIATVVKLLEKTLIRIGNDAYAEKNQSFGLTTLRNRHLSVVGDTIQFQFSGKSGVEHDILLEHSQLARTLKRCQELPGCELFQYRDSDGNLQPIDSGDINDYLQDIMGDRFSAKDFRTWFGTVRALESLIEQEQAQSIHQLDFHQREDEYEARIRNAIEQAAEQLGNRPATCKKYYIHPLLFKIYQQNQLRDHVQDLTPLTLQTLETAVLQILDSSLDLSQCA